MLYVRKIQNVAVYLFFGSTKVYEDFAQLILSINLSLSLSSDRVLISRTQVKSKETEKINVFNIR